MDTPSDLGFDLNPELPVPLSLVGGRYLLFDIKIATYLRREHRICGTTIGTLPLSPSQNLFLGVPIEIMAEEAQLLVETGVGFIVDDARAHDEALHSADKARRADYLARLQQQSRQVENLRAQEKAQSRKRAMEKRAKKSTDSSEPARSVQAADVLDSDGDEPSRNEQAESTTLDEIPVAQTDTPIKFPPNTTMSPSYQITPATSQLLLPTCSPSSQTQVNSLPTSYPLYKHLHQRGFFMTPGLRFGCQYTVYPGDPLRFHSHFLAVGTQWDEEIELMDIVGGGRLGTGVKKGFLFGGANPTGDVKTFSVEWAAM